MTDQWGEWPNEEFDTGDTADLSEAGDGYPPPAFDGEPFLGYEDELVETVELPDDDLPDGALDGDAFGDDEFGGETLADGTLADGPVTDGDVADPAVIDEPVGADPDLIDGDGIGDAGIASVFPPPLELGEPPEPVDGLPWSDPALLGSDTASPGSVAPLPDPAAGHAVAPPLGELSAYATQDLPPGAAAGWAALLASPDPATSALARFWAAGS